MFSLNNTHLETQKDLQKMNWHNKTITVKLFFLNIGFSGGWCRFGTGVWMDDDLPLYNQPDQETSERALCVASKQSQLFPTHVTAASRGRLEESDMLWDVLLKKKDFYSKSHYDGNENAPICVHVCKPWHEASTAWLSITLLLLSRVNMVFFHDAQSP